jgi:hypothetical protein
MAPSGAIKSGMTVRSKALALVHIRGLLASRQGDATTAHDYLNLRFYCANNNGGLDDFYSSLPLALQLSLETFCASSRLGA